MKRKRYAQSLEGERGDGKIERRKLYTSRGVVSLPRKGREEGGTLRNLSSKMETEGEEDQKAYRRAVHLREQRFLGQTTGEAIPAAKEKIADI